MTNVIHDVFYCNLVLQDMMADRIDALALYRVRCYPNSCHGENQMQAHLDALDVCAPDASARYGNSVSVKFCEPRECSLCDARSLINTPELKDIVAQVQACASLVLTVP